MTIAEFIDYDPSIPTQASADKAIVEGCEMMLSVEHHLRKCHQRSGESRVDS